MNVFLTVGFYILLCAPQMIFFLWNLLKCLNGLKEWKEGSGRCDCQQCHCLSLTCWDLSFVQCLCDWRVNESSSFVSAPLILSLALCLHSHRCCELSGFTLLDKTDPLKFAVSRVLTFVGCFPLTNMYTGKKESWDNCSQKTFVISQQINQKYTRNSFADCYTLASF